VGRKAHALLPAGNDDAGSTGLDLLEAECDGAKAGAADLVDEGGRHHIGQAGPTAGLARGVHPLPRRQYLPQHDFIDIRRIERGVGKARGDRHGAELVGGEARQAAVQRTDRGTTGGEDSDGRQGRTQSDLRVQRAIIPTIPSRKRRTAATKMRPCRMVTQAPKPAK